MTANRWAAVVLVGLAAPAARAAEPGMTELQTQVAGGMAKIHKVLRDTNQPDLALGYFESGDGSEWNVGPGLKLMVIEQCDRLGITLAERSNCTLLAEYRFLPRKGTAFTEMKVELKLRRRGQNGEFVEPVTVSLSTTDMRDLSRYGGVCVPLPEDGTAEQRNAAWGAAVADPAKFAPHVHGPQGSRVSTKTVREEVSPYAVELLAGPAGSDPTTPRKVTLVGGLPYAVIERGEEYRIRLVNTSDHEMAASVTVDGIDVFAFTDDRTPLYEPVLGADGKPQGGPDGKDLMRIVYRADGKPLTRPAYTHWIVPARGEVVIKGWHKTAEGDGRYQAFLVTEYGKGAASRMPQVSAGKVGQISVQFARAYRLDDKGARAKSVNETGFGRDLTGPQQPVERKIDVACDIVTIRYNRPAEKK